MINSATDHGYNTDWSIRVHSGLTCRDENGDQYKVLRWYSGEEWRVEYDDGRTRIYTEARILADAYAP